MKKLTCVALIGGLLVGSFNNTLASDTLKVHSMSAPAQPTLYEEVGLHNDTLYESIIVNGAELDLDFAKIYTSKAGDVMVPLRLIAEALGYHVSWNDELRQVEVTKDARWITVKIDENYYSFGKMAPISLGTMAEVTDGTTYVPMSFVTNILNVSVNDHPMGKIDISEKVENKKINDLSMTGNIIDIQIADKTSQIWIKGIMPGGYEDTVVLNISEDTQLVNPITNKQLSIDDFSINDTVRGFFGPVMTASLPPQVTAEKIELLDNVALRTGTITEIRHGEKWDQIVIDGMNGIVLTVTDETEIVTEENEKFEFEDLHVNMRIDGFHDQVMTMSIPPISVAKKVVVKDGEWIQQQQKLNYQVSNGVYKNKSEDIIISYPQVTDFPGELLMGYMNQSLMSLIETYSDEATYSDVNINYLVTKKDNDVLSVLFKGTAKMKYVGEINIQQSINLDMKTSNEITYDNLVKDEKEVKQLLDEKAKEEGIEEGLEAEGIRVYFDKENIIFYYMPLDDSAKEFIELTIPMTIIENYIHRDYGDYPAS